MRYWSVSVEMLVQADDEDGAVIAAAQACRVLREGDELPAGVVLGGPLGGGDPEHVYPASAPAVQR